MKKKFLTTMIVCLSFFGLSSSAVKGSGGAIFLFDINGDVKIKRVKWPEFRKVHIGNPLSPEDLIQLDAKASAIILCGSTDKKQVKPGQVCRVSEICPSGIPTVPRNNMHRSPSRAPNETIPYIISPRNTLLLTNRPILRWNAVPGATRYQVRVQDVRLQLDWQTETNNTQIEYPGNPPLQPNFDYFLIVETDKDKSSGEEQGTDLSFTLLDTQKAESVQTEVTRLKQHQLTQEAEGLAIAYLYHSYDLKAEAIDLLEGLVKQGSQTTAIYQLLEDLYLQIGLSQQAKNSYIKALEFAQKTEDIEGQAEAQLGLGEAEYGLGNKGKAIEWFNQAKVNYTILGDGEQVQTLENELPTLISSSKTTY